MASKKLHFVTSNKDKLREARDILGIEIIPTHVDLIEPQSLDLEEIVKFKVEQAYKLVKKPVIVDDVSFEIEAWEGRPGPLIKFFLPEHQPTLLYSMMKGEKNRKVVAKCAIGYHNGKGITVVVGEVEGKIPKEIQGISGFGWDPIFIPKGFDITFAQMSPEEKNSISHRFEALLKLQKLLTQ